MKIQFDIELKEYEGKKIDISSKKNKKLKENATQLLRGISDALKKVFNQGHFTNPQINYNILSNE